MYITDFFDEYNSSHLEAYEFLHVADEFPPNFLPANIIYEKGWRKKITARMAMAYAKFGTRGDIHGMPAANQ